MEARRSRGSRRVAARGDDEVAGLARAVAVTDPVEVGVGPVAAVRGRVAVCVVVRARLLRQQRRDELVVVAAVAVEGGLQPRPRGVAVRVGAVRAETELGPEARRLPRLARDAVDPDLAVDVVRPIDGADRVVYRRRELHVRPADLKVRERRHLARGEALVARRVESADDVVDRARVAEAGVRKGRRSRRPGKDVAAARDGAPVDRVGGGAVGRIPRKADAAVAL